MSEGAGTRSAAVRRGITLGGVGGSAGAVIMAIYAMVVSGTVKDVGFFTPLHHIASAVIAPDAMMASMEAAGSGDSAFVDVGPALVGLLVHLVTGASAGAVFGAVVALARLPRPLVVGAGVAFGLLVMVVNGYVGLPLVAELFDGGEPISDMPTMVGWGTFTAEHALYGLVLGAVVARRTVAPAAADRAPRVTERV